MARPDAAWASRRARAWVWYRAQTAPLTSDASRRAPDAREARDTDDETARERDDAHRDTRRASLPRLAARRSIVVLLPLAVSSSAFVLFDKSGSTTAAAATRGATSTTCTRSTLTRGSGRRSSPRARGPRSARVTRRAASRRRSTSLAAGTRRRRFVVHDASHTEWRPYHHSKVTVVFFGGYLGDAGS